MVKVYTSIGTFSTKTVQAQNGEAAKVPVIHVMGQEFLLNEDELIVWSTLAWRFMLRDDLIKAFNTKRAEAHIFSDVSPERVIDSLVNRGLIACGEDITFDDAMYNLLCTLQPKPLKIHFFARLAAAFHLVFIKRRSPKLVTNSLLRSGKLRGDKNTIMTLINRFDLSTAELVKCFDSGKVQVKDYSELVDILCTDNAIADSIPLEMRFSDMRESVVSHISELYKTKKIIFEQIMPPA